MRMGYEEETIGMMDISRESLSECIGDGVVEGQLGDLEPRFVSLYSILT